jgi:hypothetical protein
MRELVPLGASLLCMTFCGLLLATATTSIYLLIGFLIATGIAAYAVTTLILSRR